MGKIILWTLIILGVYFSFLPNRFATTSIIDFVKGEPTPPLKHLILKGFREFQSFVVVGLNRLTVSHETHC